MTATSGCLFFVTYLKTKHLNLELDTSLDHKKTDLQLMSPRELSSLKNLSCSPMSFATKILFKIFKIDELHGHNVSGKTLNKSLKVKLPLDPVRVGYIRHLVESHYDEKECKEMLSGATSHKQDLWKSCHTAINKSILISERKAAAAAANGITLKADAAIEGLSEETFMNIINFQVGSNFGVYHKMFYLYINIYLYLKSSTIT